MSATFEEIDIKALTSEQRHTLLDNLLEYLSAAGQPLPEGIREQARKRLSEISTDGSDLVSWDDAKEELRARWK